MIRQLVRCLCKWLLVVGDVCVCVQYTCLCTIMLPTQLWHELRNRVGPLSSDTVCIDRNAAFAMQTLNRVCAPETEKYHSRLKLLLLGYWESTWFRLGEEGNNDTVDNIRHL